ncbi:HTH-type transcriptional regulator NorG [Pandoraea anhela]|uniref:HTH-type transcriptional regulator NorG n=2 Tax=Pandoraea anhela TaxID=2508295 RepID=A0A5E4W855_9BURK|nr:HTH-type transcriptional regulator NorG [Pandoraea anhela]
MQQHRTPLIEDLVYADLQFREPPAPCVKAFDREGWVLACGSFSKTLAPDYRLGWIAGGRFNEAVRQWKFRTSAAESLILSEAVGAFLQSGGYEHHLSTLRRLYSTQIATVRGLVARHFPDGTRATQPVGGFVLWVELPSCVDSVELFHAALAEGILIMPGQLYAKGPRYRHCVRLSCCQEIDERFANAIRRLGSLAQRLMTQVR